MSNYPDDINYNNQSGNSPFYEPQIVICNGCQNGKYEDDLDPDSELCRSCHLSYWEASRELV